MTRPLQKRKNTQPSLNAPRSKTSYRSEAQKSRAQVRQNPLLAEHWDHTLTPTQNFEKLGFAKKVNGRIAPTQDGAAGRKRKRGTGGEVVREKKVAEDEEDEEVGMDADLTPAVVSEMRVVRDSKGRILRVVQAGEKIEEVRKEVTDAEKAWKGAQLKDGLEDLDNEDKQDDDEEKKDDGGRLVDELEREAQQAKKGSAGVTAKKMSPREREWCASMVAKHGRDAVSEGKDAVSCDWDAMCRDRKMNVLQLSRGQMKEKIRRYLVKEGRRVVEDDD